MTRTRKATAKRTASKPRPTRKRTANTTPTPALSLVTANTPDDTTTVVDHRDPLPVRRHLFVGPHTPTELASIRAALAAASARLPIPVRSWTGSQAHLTDGTLVIHNPGPHRLFTAHIACRHGAIHGWPITTHTDLREARALTHACERRHAPKTPGDDGIELDWNKAIYQGIRPTTRLAEGIKTAKKATADTQSMSLDAIADGLAARVAADQPKEHPQP